jgi:hypothetical protein
MNFAEQMYQKSLECLFERLPDNIKREIKESIEYGDTDCTIDDTETVEHYKNTLERLGFDVEYRVDEHWGELMGKYYKISWDKSKESDN